MNEKCNALQVRNGLYLATSNALKSVRQWAACIGILVSPSSITNARDSIIKNQKVLNHMLGVTRVLNLAYNNCHFKFSVGQSTDLKDCTFKSITTGIFLNMHNGVLPEDLEYAEYIWEQHPNNEDSTNPLLALSSANILPEISSIQRLKDHFQWHIMAVLVNEYFPEFKSELGEPPSTFKLQPEKTSYLMAEAMYAKASMMDRKIEALTCLLEQSGIGDAKVFKGEGSVLFLLGICRHIYSSPSHLPP